MGLLFHFVGLAIFLLVSKIELIKSKVLNFDMVVVPIKILELRFLILYWYRLVQLVFALLVYRQVSIRCCYVLAGILNTRGK